MISIKRAKIRLVTAIFGCFFGILGLILPLFASNANVYADEIPEQNTTTETTVEETNEENTNLITEQIDNSTKNTVTRTCDNSLGSLGWLVCPTTGKISEAVDWLYDKNKEILEINPVKAEEESPIYQIWNYFLGVANIAFVIFLLVAIYSQITGVGISNYGIKKALPKLIIAAIMVNLSFLVCSLLVDASNIIGAGLRNVFSTIEESTVPYFLSGEGVNAAETHVAMTDLYGALAGGTGALITAGFVAFEGGEIWMLIPAALAALVSVVIGLITIALRQVVVILLIMIAPLAIVAYIMPNTESLFRKWKDLLVKMLVFYPMYSLLFGASSLAGWAIIASSQDGFGMILGTVVKIFPLFFSWSLMKMSGTFLGTINAKLTGFFAKPLATNKAWAESHRELTRQKFLAGNAYTPSLKLRQFLSDRKIARDTETKEYAETVSLRGGAYATGLNYKKDGSISKEGAEAYRRIIRNRKYQNIIDNSKVDFDKGLGQLEATKRSRDFAMRKRLEQLDNDAVEAFDEADAINARAELVDYNNKKSRQERQNAALNAHMDDINGYYLNVNDAGRMNRVPREDYKFHMERGSAEYRAAIDRYNKMSAIMEGNAQDTQYIMANATSGYDSVKKIYETKMQKMFDYTVPTKDLEYRLEELSKNADALKNIDAIIAGMRILNQRGDTDLVKSQLDNILDHGVNLGTRASQSLASFLMFEVKDNDPFLRRFGKYINLETARMFNKNERKESEVTYDEYIKGYHEEPDGTKMYAKKDMRKLVEGTSLDNIERTAFGNLTESLMKAYGYKKGMTAEQWEVDKFLDKYKEIMTAIEPAFLSASLKWGSGSEQINSAVRYWLGYENTQKKNPDGTVAVDENGDPIYEQKGIWDDKAFEGANKKVKKFFRENGARRFVADSTSGQIQKLRTDFMVALQPHFEDMYFGDDEDSDEYKQKKSEWERVQREIDERQYDGLSAEEQDRIKKKAKKDYYLTDIVGAPYREILDEAGKLKQISISRRSSGSNDMKDTNRKMLLLDDDERLSEEMKRRREEWARRDQNASGQTDNNDASNVGNNHAYTAGDINDILNEIEYEWTNYEHTNAIGGWYDIGHAYLVNRFGAGHTIVRKFERHHRDFPNASDNELYDVMFRLVEDPTNY